MPFDPTESPRAQSAQLPGLQAVSGRCRTCRCSPRTSGACAQFFTIEFACRTVIWRQLWHAIAIASCSIPFTIPIPFVVPEASRVEPARRIRDEIGIASLHTLRVEPDTLSHVIKRFSESHGWVIWIPGHHNCESFAYGGLSGQFVAFPRVEAIKQLHLSFGWLRRVALRGSGRSSRNVCKRSLRNSIYLFLFLLLIRRR